MVGWLVYLGKREFPVDPRRDPRTEKPGGNSGTERIYGYGNPAANPLNTTESPRKASLSNLRRNRHNVYQAVTRTEMLKILGFRFLALADDINDRSTLTATAFIGVVFLSHSCHKPSPPINGIAPKRPCKYPLRMFSPFLGEKDASEYNSVAQDFSSFSANHI